MEWKWWTSAVVVSVVMVVAAHVILGREEGIPAGLGAVCLCASVSAAPMIWRRMAFGIKMPLASTLLTITFRMLLMVAALGFVAATKWSNGNSFAVSLLGCYFIFLTLESALSICYYSSRSSR
jgi:hypothetical protein